MAFLTKKATREAKVIFDVADDSVAAAIYTLDEDKPDVIWSKRRPVNFSRHSDPTHFHRAMLQAVELLLDELHKNGLPMAHRYGLRPDVEHVRCVFSPAWEISDTVTSGFQKSEPFTPTKNHVRQAGRDAHRQFSQQLGDPEGKQFAHLSHRILSATGDGKPLSLLQRRPIQRLDIAVHISKVPTKTKREVSRILLRLFQDDVLTFHSGSELNHKVLSSAFDEPASFLVVAPGRSRTEVSVFSKGSTTKMSSTAIGEDFLVRTIAAALNRSYGEVRSRLSLYDRRKHHPSVQREISIALEEIGNRWARAVAEEAQRVTNGTPPEHAYILLPAGFTHESFAGFADKLVGPLPQIRLHAINDRLFHGFFHNTIKIDHRLALGILGTDQY